MKHLAALGPYFWKYRRRFLLGVLFIVVSNYFAVLAPQVTGFIIDVVQLQLRGESPAQALQDRDPLVSGVMRNLLQQHHSFGNLVALCGLMLLVLALLRGLFMFLMR
ncbi:MAG: ABC transporter, partial [Bacteroidetes bacterium]|nr:ABC transporter [Bacteroidota bacterium]